jgi:hypothetical protein
MTGMGLVSRVTPVHTAMRRRQVIAVEHGPTGSNREEP